ncbi:GAF and ANTAR domain-containing protein [Mycobacterium sp. SMC-8]|uniref:GAF and ANTAR domain-containing protein n=1 Tax=Mycobacterium sp. SMC-8 TaxID=2857060 RepID=UPI0021B17A8A|nr:GAF and ANTAR domain-containing protein [Mycobacterium sp. SMC-8]UXA15279.1 GAF and ANTAR domain-containing protein [Mycobacterium sp. SMC-8]
MMDDARETQVLDALVSFVDRLLVDVDVVDLLIELTERCAELFDVAAGFLLADQFGKLNLLAASSEQARELELFQLRANEGPCLGCYASGEPVSVADLHGAVLRWPRFVPAALDAGFGSVDAVPMCAAGDVVGALGLFAVRPDALTDADRHLAQTLAHIVCVTIVQDLSPARPSLLPQLRAAFAARVVVDQATSFLREVLGVSVEDAFEILRAYARARGEHLSHVARRLMTDKYSRPVLVAAILEFAGEVRD